MDALLIAPAVGIFGIRLATLCRLWSLPLKHGDDHFLAQPVGPGFYRGDGSDLLRRYRRSLFIPLLLDAPLALWLVVTHRYYYLALEGFIGWILGIIIFNVMLTHFSYRAAAVAGPAGEPPVTTVQLSMAPRRLRDHTNRAVEIVIAASLGLAVLMISRGFANDSHGNRGGIAVAIWVSYMQFGLLLLKGVFVRWRMPLPARRTEEFRQWRSAWLGYHLKTFDAVRVALALSLLGSAAVKLFWDEWTRAIAIAAIGVAILAMALFIAYATRELRRVRAVERELNPIDLVKEFPRRPVPAGRFLAGGLLYVNRDNPGVIVRSQQGIAINLAHPTTYAWAAYLVGLITLTTWIAR